MSNVEKLKLAQAYIRALMVLEKEWNRLGDDPWWFEKVKERDQVKALMKDIVHNLTE